MAPLLSLTSLILFVFFISSRGQMIRGERNPAMGQGQGENIGVQIGFITLLFFFHNKNSLDDCIAVRYLF